MRYPLLYGEYELTIDDKNRLLVPAEIRKQIDPERDGEAFFLIIGINRVPWLYPEKWYEELAAKLASEMAPGEDLVAFDQLNFALTARLDWDKQGRVLIPEKTLKRTALDREVTLLGCRDHLELWTRAAWETRREQILGRTSEIALRAKQALQTPPSA